MTPRLSRIGTCALSALLVLSQSLFPLFAQQPTNNQTPITVVVLRQHPEQGPDQTTFAPPTKDEIKEFQSGAYSKGKAVYEFSNLRQMLKNEGLPFEPYILLEKNWREHIRNYTGHLFSRTSFRKLSREFEGGAIVADTLVLPEKTLLKEDTVILANRIFFEGTNAEIRSYGKKIAVFIVEEMSGTKEKPLENRAKNLSIFDTDTARGFWNAREKAAGGKYKISSQGFGYPDWLISKGVDIKGLAHLPYLNPCQSGTDYCPSTAGVLGSAGQTMNDWPGVSTNGEDSPDPVDGSCLLGASPHGQNTDDATDGDDGQKGFKAHNPDQEGGAGPGGDAAPITCSIPDGTIGSFSFDARGGQGGIGGKGGPGGYGGRGGDAKRGGDGVTCGTIIGNGGDAGYAGWGGDAGEGGDGGNGGKGGNGANITVDYPAGMTVTAVTGKGLAGLGGSGGDPGIRGIGGDGARGGNPGNNTGDAYGARGQGRGKGRDGSINRIGDAGTGGSEGDLPGSVYVTERPPTGGGGGPGCRAMPEGTTPDYCGCTPYYWVHYISWDGGQIWQVSMIEYAGCW